MGMGPFDISYFGETDFRNRQTKFGIKQQDRLRHMYVIGKTGMGKSTLLENIAVQDIQNGNGLCFLDPHGQTAELLLDYIPEERIDDVLYFAPFDLQYPISFNVLEDVGPERRHLVASGLMSAFKKIWVDAWSARMEYLLNNAMLALLEYPDSTLLSINRMFADKVYRKNVVANVSDVSVKAFWVNEFESYNERYAQEATAAIQNKVGQFTANPLVRNIVGQTSSSFDFRKLMDEEKIVIANFSKGQLGEDNANLLGSMLITKLYLAAMSRADLPLHLTQKLPPFYFFVDEFQSFANESFANILSEARKYKLALTVAHQYVEQMTEEIAAAVFGNVGTMITFRVGARDAEIFEKEYFPQFTQEDLVNLGPRQIYLRLMIDGAGSKPFSANTLPPIPETSQSFRDIILDRSRSQFAQPQQSVEHMLRGWHVSPIGRVNNDGSPKLPEAPSQQVASPEGYNEPKQIASSPQQSSQPAPRLSEPHYPPIEPQATVQASQQFIPIHNQPVASTESYNEPKQVTSAQGNRVPKQFEKQTDDLVADYYYNEHNVLSLSEEYQPIHAPSIQNVSIPQGTDQFGFDMSAYMADVVGTKKKRKRKRKKKTDPLKQDSQRTSQNQSHIERSSQSPKDILSAFSPEEADLLFSDDDSSVDSVSGEIKASSSKDDTANDLEEGTNDLKVMLETLKKSAKVSKKTDVQIVKEEDEDLETNAQEDTQSMDSESIRKERVIEKKPQNKNEIPEDVLRSLLTVSQVD